MEQSLQEIYIGSEVIQPLQESFSKIRKKIAHVPFTTSMNVDKDILKFNRQVESFFGYNTFSLNISPSSEPNAYAFPVDIYNNDEQKRRMINSLKAAKTGFKHDPKNGKISAVCTLHKGLIDLDFVTDREIFAVLLHEMGHTFFEAVNDKDCIYTVNNNLIAACKVINSKIFDCASGKVEPTLEKIKKDISSLSSFFKKSYDFIKPLSIIDSIKAYFHKNTISEAMSDNMNKNRIRYTNEKFADSFCAMYGYAVEHHSYQIKLMDYIIKSANVHQTTNPTLIHWRVSRLLNRNLREYLNNTLDEHPEDLARIKVSIDYLKKELTRESLDPKMKQMLLNQINDLQKLIDDYISIPPDEDNIAVARAYYTELYKQFGGDRREQDTDNDALFDNMDTRYRELMKKGK